MNSTMKIINKRIGEGKEKIGDELLPCGFKKEPIGKINCKDCWKLGYIGMTPKGEILRCPTCGGSGNDAI